jgi:hypothetical protein
VLGGLIWRAGFIGYSIGELEESGPHNTLNYSLVGTRWRNLD